MVDGECVPNDDLLPGLADVQEGAEGNGPSGIRRYAGNDTITLSADGRFVAFVSAATNLVSGDENGFEDVFLPSGMGYPWPYWRSALLMNNRDGTFTDHSGSTGIDPPPGGTIRGKIGGKDEARSGRSAAVADFDGDGRLDVIANNFNDRPYLFMNRWPQRDFIAFRLQGRRRNRDAIGALVHIHAGNATKVRQVHAAGGYLAQSSKTVHFGLGDMDTVERCVIRWPGGHEQVIESPEKNRIHTVVEPAE